jgi:outer membrane protein assembly factor BamB
VKDRIYFATAPSHDETPSHGWVFGYDAKTLAQTGIFNASVDGTLAGIWQSGRAMAADDDGNLYLETGNGDWDGKRNFGESFVKLDRDLKITDWYTPEYWAGLNANDWDMGCAGPLLIPGTSLVTGGSKIGVLYTMDRSNMGHLQRKGHAIAQSFLVTRECDGQTCYFITNLAYWNHETAPTLYIWGMGDVLKTFRLSQGKLEPQPEYKGSTIAEYPGGEVSLSSDGSRPGTGILWALTQNKEQEGLLQAFDAADPGHELWNSRAEPYGKASLFVAPVVADGKVFVTSDTGELTVYGLRAKPADLRH